VEREKKKIPGKLDLQKQKQNVTTLKWMASKFEHPSLFAEG